MLEIFEFKAHTCVFIWARLIHIYLFLAEQNSLEKRRIVDSQTSFYLWTGIATAAWVSVASSALHREVTVLVCKNFPVIFQKFSSNFPTQLSVVLNLCEEVDPLLAIEVAVPKEGSARSGEAHHGQRDRDGHVHLRGKVVLSWNFQHDPC